MLSRPFLDESLALTDAQKNEDSGLHRRRAKHSELGERWSYENHVNQTRKAIAILDERQQRIWIKLLGPACQFEIAGEPQAAQKQQSAARGNSQIGAAQMRRIAGNISLSVFAPRKEMKE